MPEPILGEAEGGVSGAVAPNEQGATPTTTTPTSPQPTGSAQPAKPQSDAKGDPDYKSLYETELRRRQGLDRRMSQLRGSQGHQGVDESTSGDEAEVENLRLFKAEAQLKEEATEILKSYPGIPKHIANQIMRNPRGFIKSTTQTVDEAVLDLEEYIADISDELAEAGTNGDQQLKGQIAKPNTTVTSEGKPALEDLVTPEQMDEAIKSGLYTEKELAEEMSRRGKERAKGSK